MAATEALLDCYHNGRRGTMPVKEAWRLFWQVEFAWLLPLDWCRFRLGGHSRQCFVHEVVTRAARYMLFRLTTRGLRALTVDDLRKLDGRSVDIDSEAFHQRAARFNNTLFKDVPSRLRPFVYTEVIEAGMVPKQAYTLRSSCELLLVAGTAPGCGDDGSETDWHLFMKRPTPVREKIAGKQRRPYLIATPAIRPTPAMRRQA